jgi:hypothetical protein
MASLIPTVAATVGGKTLALRRNHLAVYRLQKAGLPDDLADIFVDSKRIVALCNWLWACDTLATFATPEAVADAFTAEEVVPGMESLLAAHRAAFPPAPETAEAATPADAEKKSG